MPYVPIFVLVVSAAGLLVLSVLATIPKTRPYALFVVPTAAGLCLIGVVAGSLEPVAPVMVSRWHPTIFFRTFLLLQADSSLWGLALAVSAAVASAALVQLSRRAQPHFIIGLSTLGMLAAALGSAWSGNLLTLLIFWGAFDLAWFLGLIAAGATIRRVALGGGIGMLATFVLWAGVLVSTAKGSSLTWHLFSPPELALDLILVAGALRLGLYPFHWTLPAGFSKRVPTAGALLLGPALGWLLLLRLALAVGPAALSGTWVSTLGAVTMVMGGILAWTCTRSSEILPRVALGATGLILWGLGSSTPDTAVLVLASGGVAWVLGTTLIYLSPGLERRAPWWSAGALLGGLALIGSPLTPAFPATVSALGGPSSTISTPIKIVAFVVGQALLTAALARRALRPPVRTTPKTVPTLEIAARAVGLLLPSILILAGGIHLPLLLGNVQPHSLGQLISSAGWSVWAVWPLATGLGVVLFWQDARLRPHIQTTLGILHDLASLDWLINPLLGGLGRVTRFLQATAELMEGAGAVLWALSVFLLFVLALTAG